MTEAQKVKLEEIASRPNNLKYLKRCRLLCFLFYAAGLLLVYQNEYAEAVSMVMLAVVFHLSTQSQINKAKKATSETPETTSHGLD